MGNLVIVILAVLAGQAVTQYLFLKLMTRLIGEVIADMMTRIIQANAIGGLPLSPAVTSESPARQGAILSFRQRGHPQAAVVQSPAGVSTEEPALPPLEQTIGRMADYLEQQFREQGHPIGRGEAMEQARIMMADSGVMG